MNLMISIILLQVRLKPS